MDETTDNQAKAIDPLRLDRCPDCGYLLTALPEEGICPECGFAYDASMIVLYGWFIGYNLTREHGVRLRRPWTWQPNWLERVFPLFWTFGLLGTLLWLLLRFLWLAHLGAAARGMLWLLLALIPALLLLLSWWLTPKIPAPAPWQVRIVRGGFAFRRGIGPVRLKRWTSRHRIRLDPAGPEAYWLAVRDGGLPLNGLVVRLDDEAAERLRQRLTTWCPVLPAKPLVEG